MSQSGPHEERIGLNPLIPQAELRSEDFHGFLRGEDKIKKSIDNGACRRGA